MAIITHRDITNPLCTPEYVLNLSPCLDCLSESELMALLLYLWAWLNYDEADLPGLLNEAKCWDCMSDKQKLQAAIATMANAFHLNATTVADAVKCMPCAKPGQVKAAIVYSICKYFHTLLG